MTSWDRLVIWWHRVRFHQNSFTPDGKRWFCQCGEARGKRVIA